MSIGLLGNKIGMTEIYEKSGELIPVTILRVGPCVITQIKNVLKDGYNSIQIGYGKVPNNLLNQSQLGHLQKSDIQPLRHLKEFRIDEKIEEFKVGQIITIDSFSIGQFVNISGKSIGKGFSGLQKRHKFTRGPLTHGSKNHKAPGSIGMGTTPGRVLPGKRMAGQLGNKQITIKKLKIVLINSDENILIIKGSVPGKPGNLLSIVPSE